MEGGLANILRLAQDLRTRPEAERLAGIYSERSGTVLGLPSIAGIIELSRMTFADVQMDAGKSGRTAHWLGYQLGDYHVDWMTVREATDGIAVFRLCYGDRNNCVLGYRGTVYARRDSHGNVKGFDGCKPDAENPGRATVRINGMPVILDLTTNPPTARLA